MAYSAKVGSFNLDTSKTAGQTQAISGVGFQPKIVLFWWGGSHATGDSVAGGTFSFGFGAAISSTSRMCAFGCSEDAQAASDTLRGHSNTCCMSIWTDTATEDGIADFSSMDADGFTLTIDNQFSNDYRISYMALGGTDLTNVYIGNKLQPNATGNFNITGVGFQPDALIFASGHQSNVDAEGSYLYWSMGMATSAAAQGIVGGHSLDAQATMVTRGYARDDEVNYRTYYGGHDAFVSFGADGFTLNEVSEDSSYFFFVALKGGQYKVGSLTTRTDGNDIAVTGPGFTPVGLLFASANRAKSTAATPTNNFAVTIGAATSASERAAMAVWDKNGAADSLTTFANYDSAVYANLTDDAMQGLMDIKSIDATGFTAVMDDADPGACFVTYLAIGAAAAAAFSGKVSTCYFG